MVFIVWFAVGTSSCSLLMAVTARLLLPSKQWHDSIIYGFSDCFDLVYTVSLPTTAVFDDALQLSHGGCTSKKGTDFGPRIDRNLV